MKQRIVKLEYTNIFINLTEKNAEKMLTIL